MGRKADDVYEQYAGSVYRYLFSLTGSADMAEELTQETFFQAIKSLDQYRGGSFPSSLALCHRQETVV